MQQVFSIKLKHSMAYYLQTNEQTKQINYTIEKYL